MSISKRERRTHRPAGPRPGDAQPTLPAPLQDRSERLAEAVESQAKLFATLRTYPLETGEEPAVVFRP